MLLRRARKKQEEFTALSLYFFTVRKLSTAVI